MITARIDNQHDHVSAWLHQKTRQMSCMTRTDHLAEFYEQCIRSEVPELPESLADLRQEHLDQLNLSHLSPELSNQVEDFKGELLHAANHIRNMAIGGTALELYTRLVVQLNQQLLDLEVSEKRHKDSMLKAAKKATEAVSCLMNSSAWKQLITGVVLGAVGFGAPFAPESVRPALQAVSMQSSQVMQTMNLFDQGPLTLLQHHQSVKTEEWRNHQAQVKQMREECARNIQDVMAKMGNLYAAMAR